MTSSKAPTRVFLSVMHTLAPSQQAVALDLEGLLVALQCQPITIGRQIERSPNAGVAIRDAIETTAGTIVIAFAKLRVFDAAEYPGSNFEHQVKERSYASAWSHIEAAMTIQARHPLLLLCEKSVYREGVLRSSFHSSISFSIPEPYVFPEAINDATVEWIKSLHEKQVL